jgi:hypothetical protein
MKDNKSDIKPYYAKVIKDINNGEGYCTSLLVGVFDENDNKIGEYTRNYQSLYNTFEVFKQKGKWLALFSADYETTSIMELPSCKVLGNNNTGFCPVDFYVPNYYWHKFEVNGKDESGYVNEINTLEEIDSESLKVDDLKYHDFGFIAGCYWGDDSSWKIQKLDLTKAYKGKVKLEESFGYLEMPDKIDLRDCIDLDYYDNEGCRISIAVRKLFYLDKKVNQKYGIIKND